MPGDPWIVTVLVAYAVCVGVFVGAIVVQAIKFYRKQRAPRSRVVPFRQEH